MKTTVKLLAAALALLLILPLLFSCGGGTPGKNAPERVCQPWKRGTILPDGT